MIKRLESKHKMYEGVISLLKENEALVNANKEFASSVSAFSETVKEIGAKDVQTVKASKGKTATKHNAEEELIEILAAVCSGLFLVGRKKKDMSIMERTDISENGLDRLRDTELANFSTDMAETC
jgi:hypothetical protein